MNILRLRVTKKKKVYDYYCLLTEAVFVPSVKRKFFFKKTKTVSKLLSDVLAVTGLSPRIARERFDSSRSVMFSHKVNACSSQEG